MTKSEERSIAIFVDATGPFDRVLADLARRSLLQALARLAPESRTEGKQRKPQIRELAVELGVHPRRVVRLLEAFNLRDRCRERVVHPVVADEG